MKLDIQIYSVTQVDFECRVSQGEASPFLLNPESGQWLAKVIVVQRLMGDGRQKFMVVKVYWLSKVHGRQMLLVDKVS